MERIVLIPLGAFERRIMPGKKAGVRGVFERVELI